MAHPITSRKRAQAYSSALFLIGLAVLAYTEVWWPGIMLVIGLSMGLRQYLLARYHDTMVTLLVFVGTFVTVEFDISWRIFLPILFTIGAIYLVMREYMEESAESEEEVEEDTSHEIEERKKK